MTQYGLNQLLRQRFTFPTSKPPSAMAVKFDSVAAMQKATTTQETLYGDLNYPNGKQYLAFPSYTCMSSFAERNSCMNILEIGAGLSTAVWANLAAQTGARIRTLDANLSRMQSYVKDTRHEALVAKHVELIEGVSIECEEFIDFYTGTPQTNYGGVEIATLRNHVDNFHGQNCSIKRRYKAKRVAQNGNWTASELMITESRLSLPRSLLDLFSSNGDFENEIAFLKDAEQRGVAGLISKLRQEESLWDMIFFDSGELASMLEWTRLKDYIAIGGFAAFHDIFFPKSIKNIIPCAAVMADPDWEIVFCDDSTRQGLLIAERLR